jgi:platelet-activating factor acetylhydrolase
MVVNAEGFTLWKDHFKRVEEIVPAWPGSVLVTVGTHLAISVWQGVVCY